MFVSYYQQCMSIALQCAQVIAILKRVIAFGWGSSSLPHIITSALPLLVDLWQTTTLSSYVFFVIIDCHFVAMGPICIGFLPYLIVFFCFFFGLCVLVHSFALYFWWMGSSPWFKKKNLYTWFFFFLCSSLHPPPPLFLSELSSFSSRIKKKIF